MRYFYTKCAGLPFNCICIAYTSRWIDLLNLNDFSFNMKLSFRFYRTVKKYMIYLATMPIWQRGSMSITNFTRKYLWDYRSINFPINKK